MLLALVEAGSFVFATYRPDLFDGRALALAKLQTEPLEQFKSVYASRTLGWDNPRSRVLTVRDCLGADLSLTFGPVGDRLHGRSEDALVVMAGDSVTQGGDAGDSDTYPAALERILGVPIANIGVGGYDPVQALLKLEATIGYFPRARVVVLSIFDDDVWRMLNSYRPVLLPGTGIHFGLKPFWRDGAFHSIIADEPFRDIEGMRQAAILAFDTDYWRRPVAAFPYALAVADLLSSPSFWVPQLVSAGRMLGYRPFEVVYRIPSIQNGLRAVYERFASFAQARGLKPVVAFIPDDPNDGTSGLIAIAAATQMQREAISFVNVVPSDPKRYRTAPGCHPQADGYRMIAESVSEAVRPLLARDR